MKHPGLRRVDTLDLLSLLGLDEFVVDEEPNRLLVLAAIRRCKVDEEIGRHGFSIRFFTRSFNGFTRVVVGIKI